LDGELNFKTPFLTLKLVVIGANRLLSEFKVNDPFTSSLAKYLLTMELTLLVAALRSIGADSMFSDTFVRMLLFTKNITPTHTIITRRIITQFLERII